MQRLRTPKWIRWALAIWKLVTLITICSNFELSCILCIKILMRANDYINTTHSSYLPSRLGSQISLHILELVPANSCDLVIRYALLRATGVCIPSIDKFDKMVIYSWQINKKKRRFFDFFFYLGKRRLIRYIGYIQLITLFQWYE